MKKIAAIVTVLAVILAFASCNSKPAAKDVKLTEVYDKIAEKITLPSMYDLDADEISEMIGIQAADVKQSVYKRIDDVSKVDQIIMVEAADETKAGEIKDLLQAYLKSLIDQSANYDPAAVKTLNNSSVRQDGTLVCLFISDSASEMLSVYDGQIK